MPAANTFGVIYVASRKPNFLCEAIASAESLKQKLPEIPITLFTDLEDVHRLVIKPFDKISPIPQKPGASLNANRSFKQTVVEHTIDHLSGYYKHLRRFLPGKIRKLVIASLQQSWGRGTHAKVMSLIHSPYQRTLFLDSDTRVLSNECVQVFDFLKEHSIAMVPCTAENSMSCRLLGPMFNSGVIAYRKDTQVDTLFREWEQLNRLHFELAGQYPPGSLPYLSGFNSSERRFLLTNDQTSLAQVLSPTVNTHNIAVKILDEQWNARGYPRDCLDKVIVDHADIHKIKPDQVQGFLKSRGIPFVR